MPRRRPRFGFLSLGRIARAILHLECGKVPPWDQGATRCDYGAGHLGRHRSGEMLWRDTETGVPRKMAGGWLRYPDEADWRRNR